MAFSSGSSLFGAKPAGTGLFGSTTAQPSGGLFGQAQTQQQQPTTGLFGQTQQQQNPPSTAGTGLFGQPQQQGTTGGLFGSTSTQQPATTGGLFGQTSQQQNPPPAAAGGGLFGNTNPTANQGTSGGIFGNTNTNQPTTGSTGGLFGNTSTTQSTTGGLFGNATANNNTQGTTGGLFGNTNTNQGTTGGLFGSSTTNQGSTGGLFGSTTTNQGTQPTPGLFGSTTQPQTNSGFSGFGLSKQPSQTPGLGASTQQGNNPVIQKSTKFNDLPDSIRSLMENIDSHIQGRVQISKELQQRKLGEEPTKGQASIKKMHKELIDITSAIRNDSHTTQDLKIKVDQSIEDTVVAIRIIDAFRNPQGGNTYLKDHASFPLEYFTRIADQIKERLQWYKTTIEQIERKLSSSSAQSQTPQGLVQTLQAQHQAFLALASKTAALEAEMQKIKSLYTQLWRAKTGSVRDPFNDTPRSSETPDFGMSTLAVR